MRRKDLSTDFEIHIGHLQRSTNHSMLGWGSPTTTHSSVTVPPSCAISLFSGCSKLGDHPSKNTQKIEKPLTRNLMTKQIYCKPTNCDIQLQDQPPSQLLQGLENKVISGKATILDL